MREGSFSVSDIMALTRASEAQIADALDTLQTAGLACISNGDDGGLMRYAALPNAGFCLGVDLGGTKILAALSDLSGRIVAEIAERTDPRGDYHVLDQIKGIAGQLAAMASLTSSDIQTIAVGIPGAVSPATGVTSLLPNINGFADIHIGRGLGERFGRHVIVENDVNMAILGEAWRGSAKGRRNASFMALGTGVGLGNIAEGELLRGMTGAAGEIAFLPIGRNVTSGEARKYGSFELEVGTRGIVARCQDLGAAGIVSAKDVFDLLETGNSAAVQTIDETARYIALAITCVQFLLDPELVVLGGSIGSRIELASRVEALLPAMAAAPVKIAVSQLGNRAGLLGALSLAIKQSLLEHMETAGAEAIDAGTNALDRALLKPSRFNA